MPARLGVVAAAVIGVVLVTACGGESSSDGGDNVFKGDGYSFTYPGAWVERTDIESASGEGTGPSVGPPEGADLLYIGTSGLTIPITEQNVAEYAEELAAEVDDVFREAQGRVTSEPQSATVAGLPALRLEATAVNTDGIETKAHVTLVYDGKTEYFLNCQYTPDGADEMTQGCNQVVDSFAVE
jgi:hypothetical protein